MAQRPHNEAAGEPPRPPGTPDDVRITWEAREPVTDPTLGIVVDSPRDPAPARHRLVAVGDSLAHGFQSFAISRTALSWPALVAHQLAGGEFRYPTYEGYGGLPFNLEACVRHIEREFGHLNLLEAGPAAAWLLDYAHQVEHWWAVEADKAWTPPPGLNHNLGVYSFDIADGWRRTRRSIEAAIVPPTHEWRRLQVANDVERAARRVLANADASMGTLDVAEAHGRDGGIETLLIELGSNNVLDVVVRLHLVWGTNEDERSTATVWSPGFFAQDWAELVTRVRRIRARHVIFCTVPHVSIAPLFSAVGDRLRPDSRYFQYYTHAWMARRFHPGRNKSLTGEQARAIDSAIDQYNETIVESVSAARRSGLDWYVFELAGLLDRLAYRRYLSNPAAKPSWWERVGGDYQLPPALAGLDPVPDTRFFLSDASGRTQGGLFALDGVHPTTVGYGIAAQETIRVMERAGVDFRAPGAQGPPSPVAINFEKLVENDSLLSNPPTTLTEDFHALAWINDKIDLIQRWRGHPPM